MGTAFDQRHTDYGNRHGTSDDQTLRAWQRLHPESARAKRYRVQAAYPGSGEYERYRGIFAVKDGKLVSYNFAYDGGNTLDDVSVEGNVLKIRRAVTNVDVPTVIHQEIERAGDDKFKWRVWLEREGKKDQIMDGEWTRAAAKKA